ncbi:DUF6531 domain-containing protein [Saccharothrix deserti]|uniref:DUF6531 domain-containing protein n=1 Tax=Saccharothrix deserti TaxID=2593674 RepID=UPI00131E4ABC|nr:DUF6531 domain-containing protein [Saccharothrix deserti]
MTEKSLVAKPVDETEWYSGISQVEDAKAVSEAVKRGDWIEAGIAGAPLGMDLAMCATDPTAALGIVVQAGVGWLLEHVEPLRDALDKLAGNPAVVKSFGQTWQNVAERMTGIAEDCAADVKADLSEWTGTAADAYRKASAERVDALRATAEICSAVSSAVTKAGELVTMVRILVRDMIAALVSALIEAVLPPLVLVRAHRSDYRVGRWFGPSWASTLDQRIEVTRDAVHFAAEDGMLLRYPVPAGTAVLPVQGTPWPLARTESGGFTITDPVLGRTLHFEASTGSAWPISAVVDRNGNRIDFERDGDGVPTGIRHSGGYHIVVDTAGERVTGLRLIGATAEIVLTDYRYDEAGRLTEVLNSSNAAMRFDYDEAGRITRWEDRNGMWYRFTYDEEGRCTGGEGRDGHLSYRFEYDRVNRVTRSTDSLGHTTTHHLNEQLQIVREVDPLGNTTSREWDRHHRLLTCTDALGRVTRYTYDNGGNLTSITRPDGSLVRAEYDESGFPTTIVQPDGAVWRQEHDSRGNLVAVTDPTGAITTYTYDSRGHVTEHTDALGNTRRIRANAAGLPVAVTDALGATTDYARDDSGRITAVTDPAGGVTRFGWTIEGNPLWRRLPDGATERWRYDGEGNEVEYVDALGQTTRIDMGHFDMPTAETGPDGARTRFEYDTEIRLTRVVNPQGLVWRYEYDAAGNLVRETDFNSRVLEYRFDAANQLVERVNAVGDVVHFTRDAHGRVVEQRAGDVVARFEYDPVGRMIRATNTDATLEWRRDPLGRVLAEICNGRVVASTYDAAGRRTVTADRGFGRGPVVLQRRSYNYRADGHVTAIVDLLSGSREFALDPVGRATEVRGPGPGERYAYDPSGNITHAVRSEPDLDGARVHDGTLVRQAGKVRYEYDAQGRVVSRRQKRLSSGPLVWRYTWDADDRLVAVTTADGQHWRYRYDPLGRRIAKQHLRDSAVVEQVDFTWDGAVLAEESARGRATVWEWHPDGVRPLSQTERVPVADAPQEWVDERFFAIVTDLSGRTSELIDPAGEVAWHTRTTLWGFGLDHQGRRFAGDVRLDDRIGGDHGPPGADRRQVLRRPVLQGRAESRGSGHRVRPEERATGSDAASGGSGMT